ncbi:isoprenylcysteine carboxylmethyltransferase family protein [candidate division WOR-3 bacterium]|nr:isoprenylcysteine carboxylmethyltransferase family protein [candidate division WOR-3 bacterium]
MKAAGRKQGHKDREDLAGEHPFDDAGQLILLIVFLIVWIADSFILRASIFPARYVPLLLWIPIGCIFLGAAAYFAKEGMRIVFDERREVPAVITEGVFGRVRHPVYLGCILFCVGVIVFTLSIFSVPVLIAIVVFYHYIARHEERLLLVKFGAAYEQYTRSVPMWVPRLCSRNTVRRENGS